MNRLAYDQKNTVKMNIPASPPTGPEDNQQERFEFSKILRDYTLGRNRLR